MFYTFDNDSRRSSGIVVSDADYCAVDLGSNPGEDINVCKCIVPSWQGDAINILRVGSPLVMLVEGKERWETPDHPQCILPQNWGETELNRSVTFMVHKATTDVT
ncbi:uncharacterized protein TNCV_4248881 [Trichonephila clavipes]|nr:uncharacterized protein TNCV_4248881 [Trichonephila clavipes]